MTTNSDTSGVLTGWSLIDSTEGYEVDDDVTTTPCCWPGRQPVTTWQEGYPYHERMPRQEYEHAKRSCRSSC